MSGEIVKEWHFWLASIITGVFMAFAYDVLRLIRRIVRHGRIAVDLEDILYWTACFGLSFTLLYYGNNGVIRFAAVFGAAVGMLIYAMTMGRFFVKTSFMLIDKTIGNLLRFIRKIMQKIHRWLMSAGRRIKRRIIGIFRKFRLTCAAKRHKMKVYSHKKAKSGKGETADGKSKQKKCKKDKKSKNSKKKNTRVSPREE